MPGDKRGVPGKLNEPIRSPHQEIGANRAFDRVQNLGMRDHRVNPGEHEVGKPVHGAPLPRNQLAQAVFVLICVFVELPAEFRRLAVAEDPNRIKITILLVKLLLFRAKHDGFYSLRQKRLNQSCQLVRLGEKRVVAMRGNQLPVLATDSRFHHAFGQSEYILRWK